VTARLLARRGPLGLLAALILTAALAWTWWAQVGRWQAPLYCIAQRGTVWNGLFPLLEGASPRCPRSATYRREVRDGLTRVEQYRLEGWQPLALMGPLRDAGYGLLEDETGGPDHYSVFLGRVNPAELYYTAVPDGTGTLITLSGP